MKRTVTMTSKDYGVFMAGFHTDAAEEFRVRARTRFEKLYKKLVLTDQDKGKWPP